MNELFGRPLKLGANRQTLFFKHCDVSCLKSMLDGLRSQKSCLFNKKMFETMFEQVHNLFKQMKSFYWPNQNWRYKRRRHIARNNVWRISANHQTHNFKCLKNYVWRFAPSCIAQRTLSPDYTFFSDDIWSDVTFIFRNSAWASVAITSKEGNKDLRCAKCFAAAPKSRRSFQDMK